MIGWGTMVGDPISDDDLSLIVRAFSSALLSDYKSLSLSLSLSLCLFPEKKKFEFGNYLVELCKEFFGILYYFLSLILSIDISLPCQ